MKNKPINCLGARQYVILSFVVAMLTSTAKTQSTSSGPELPPFSIVIAIGGGGRIGQLPAAYSAGGPHVVVDLVFAVRKGIPLEASLDLSAQTHEVRSATSTESQVFDIGQLAVGPGFAMRMAARSTLSGSLQGALLFSGWRAKGVGSCGPNCVIVSGKEVEAQNEISLGLGARLRADFRLHHDELTGEWLGIGIELRSLTAPRHKASEVPLSHFGISIALIGHLAGVMQQNDITMP